MSVKTSEYYTKDGFFRTSKFFRDIKNLGYYELKEVSEMVREKAEFYYDKRMIGMGDFFWRIHCVVRNRVRYMKRYYAE